MKILHVIRSVNPSGGGPIEGILRLSAVLTSQGHSVDVASLDWECDPHLLDFPLTVFPLGMGNALKYGYSRRLRPWLRSNLKNYDSVIVNGLWQYHGFATMK